MKILLLFILMAPPPSPTLRQAVKLSLNGDHEKSEVIFRKLKPKGVTYNFYRLVNNYSLNKKEEAIKWANLVLYGFDEIPPRYHDLTVLMIADMEYWKKADDDLEDISREMKKAADRLKNSRGDKKTQGIQKEVENRLARIIKKMEDKKNQQKEEQEEKEGKEQNKPQPPPDSPPNTIEKNTGSVYKKQIKEIAEVWGKLPEKERVKIIQEFTRKMPEKDRTLIELYFKNLYKTK